MSSAWWHPLLGRFLNGRLEPQAQVMFALAHEVGHRKLRDAFLNMCCAG